MTIAGVSGTRSSTYDPSTTNYSAMAMVTTLFFMWGFCTVLNDRDNSRIGRSKRGARVTFCRFLDVEDRSPPMTIVKRIKGANMHDHKKWCNFRFRYLPKGGTQGSILFISAVLLSR